MLSRLLASIILASLSASPKIPQSATIPQAPEGTAGITGTVTRIDTGKPIAGAVIQIIPAVGGTGWSSTKSDDQGHYQFKNLAVGQYALQVTASGFAPLDATINHPSGAGKFVTLADGQQLNHIDFAFAPLGGIEGRVLDDFGDPAPGVTVQIAQLMQVAGKPVLLPGGTRNSSGPTDDKGQFRFYGLAPGDYYVLALSGPFGLSAGALNSPQASGPVGFAPTFFPGTEKAGEAKPIRVEVGKPTPPAIFSLVGARMSSISGKVIDAAGAPTISGRLMLLQTHGRDLQTMIPATTEAAADGTFTFRNVPPGTYVVQGFSQNAFGSSFVTVPPNDDGKGVTGVELRARPLTTARGRITFEGAPPPPKDRVLLTFLPLDFTSGPSGGNRIPTQIHDDWTFEIGQLAWTGTIRVAAAGPWRLKSIMLGGHDIADLATDFQSADVNDLEIVMTTELGSVSGTVADGAKPAMTYAVAIFSDDKEKWTYPSRFVIAARPGADGSFRLDGLLPGGYLAVAVPAIPIPTGAGTPDSSWLTFMTPLASSFRIAGTESVTLSLKLVKP